MTGEHCMPLSDTIHRALLSAEERSSIAEIEATTNILQLVTRMTGTRFAAIAKFTDTEWIVCSAYDPIELGIHTGDTLELETTLCSEFRRDPKCCSCHKSVAMAGFPRVPW
jgi:hypothetical protein